MVSIFLSLFFLFAMSCATPYKGDSYGAEEFVLDSYQVREGKLAILEMAGEKIESWDPSFLEEYKDSVDEGDLLDVEVARWTKREDNEKKGSFAKKCRVREGVISLPELEKIEVKGLTLEEVEKRIWEKYQEKNEEVEIFVSYEEREAHQVEITGFIKRQFFPVDGKLHLFDLLMKADLSSEANLFKSYLVREGKVISLDLYKLIKEGDMSQNIILRGKDKIYIAEPYSAFLMVVGEVEKPGIVALPYGFISLQEVLAKAKVFPLRDKLSITVVRGNAVEPKTYTLKGKHIRQLPSQSLLLVPGDVIHVKGKN